MGVIGAGNYAQIMLLPHLKHVPGLDLRVVVTAGGRSAEHAAKRFGFTAASSSADDVLNDRDIDAVVIATRHDSHADLAGRALEAGKHVFLEKPLALDEGQLAQLSERMVQSDRLLMAGFNRRFSPLAIQAREFFRDCSGPLAINYRVNAGYLPLDHWTQHPEIGGGRIIGEGCHFVDLLSYLTDSMPIRAFADSAETDANDTCTIVLRFDNGSIGNVSYFATGERSFPKERIEIFGGGSVLAIEDFHRTIAARGGKLRRRKLRGRDKGHKRAIGEFFGAIRAGAPPPIPYEGLFATTRATFAAMESLRTGLPCEVSTRFEPSTSQAML